MSTTKKQQIKKHIESLGLKVVREERRDVKRPLSEDELKTIAEQGFAHVRKGLALENEKKEITKALGEEQKKEEAAAQILAKKYEDKFEEMKDDCLVAVNYETKTRQVFAISTGLMIAEEAMTNEDLQVTIFDEPEGSAEGETAPAGEEEPSVIIPPYNPALQIGLESAKGNEVIEVNGTVLDADDLADVLAGATEKTKLNTQIRLVEVKAHVTFITTAEKIVLFTEDKAALATAQMAAESRQYVNIEYEHNENARNHQLTSIELVEVPSVEELMREIDEDLPEGVESRINDPDGGEIPAMGSDELDDLESELNP